MRPAIFRGVLPVCLVAIALAATAHADRPSAMKLFPENTLVFIRMANAHEFGERFQQTAMGRMIRDPQLKPFVEHLYGKAGDLYAQHAESKLGLTWDDLKKLPQGEVAFAVVARERKSPALLLLVDQGAERSVADKLVDRALDYADKAGADFSTEEIGDVKITVVRDHDRQNRMFGVFERDNTIVVATDPDVLRNVLWHWDHAGDDAKAGEQKNDGAKSDAEFIPTRTLAQNSSFATIIRECRRKQDPPPHLIFFVDPIALVNNFGRDNGGMQFALAMLPMLGIDGIQGAGGAITYATGDYDDLSQLHVLLENPRAGIVQILSGFEAGDTTPQPFVPREIETYSAFHWNVRSTYDRVGELVDRFGSKGAVDTFMKDKVSDKLGIDVVAQVFDNLKGRFTWMIGYDRPSRLRGHHHVVAAELKDETVAVEALKTVVGRFPERFEEKHFGNVTYYGFFPRRSLRDTPAEERPATPFVAVMDGYLFIGTSSPQFERCIAARDGTAERLVDSDSYARTSAVLGRETTGKTPVLFSMSQMEETMRQWYDLLTSPETREKLEEQKEKNPLLAALAETLDSQQLPAFEVLTPYFAPGGGIIYDTDSGYHGISFTLRSKAEP